MKITDLAVIPIAFADPPLLSAFGVHEPHALRTIVRLEIDGGTIVGWGEGQGGAIPLSLVSAVRDAVVGCNVFETTVIERRIDSALRATAPLLSTQQRLIAASPVEVACLDAQGKLLGIPVVDVLGGAVRENVDFSAYLFFKWPGHLDEMPDLWGAALDAEGIVEQARRLIEGHGFRSLKLKGGVFPPPEEIEVVEALAAAFPGVPLRLDPNGAWTVETSIAAARSLEGTLEYLEDPTLGIDGMSMVAANTSLPLATNMCVVETADIGEAIEKRAVRIVLSDHHYWGGLRRTKELAAVCEAAGLEVSMHSNSHLGVSLAAMVHAAAALPDLPYACDTHYPWNSAGDILESGSLSFSGGALRVPTGPGLGIEIDEDRLAQAHERFVRGGRTRRDDAGYMKRFDPSYDERLPRF